MLPLPPPRRAVAPRHAVRLASTAARRRTSASLRTKTLDPRGFDSGGILMLRGGTLMSVGNFTAILSQRILAGRFVVRRVGVVEYRIVLYIIL